MNLVYLDDNIDTLLEKYLVKFCNEKGINYHSLYFENDKITFTNLIMADSIRTCNILIIDSYLFESRVGDKNRFTGEEFYLILKKIYPFIEVVVVSNKHIEEEVGEIVIQRKYLRGRKHTNESADNHYDFHLKPHLEEAIKSLEAFNHIKEKINHSSAFDSVLIDKINNSFSGNNDYDNLQKKDIDSLIEILKTVL